MLTNPQDAFGMNIDLARMHYKQLTKREREAAKHIADGIKFRKAAELMEISPKTFDIHRAHIYAKLHTKSLVFVAKIVLLLRIFGEENLG